MNEQKKKKLALFVTLISLCCNQRLNCAYTNNENYEKKEENCMPEHLNIKTNI